MALLPTQEANAAFWARHHYNKKKHAVRENTKFNIIISLNNDTTPFQKEHLRQQLDKHLEWYFRQEWIKNLISFYWEDVYKEQLTQIIDKISNDSFEYCEFGQEIKLKLDKVNTLIKEVYS